MRVVILAPEDLPIPAVRGGSVQIYLQAVHKALHSYDDPEVYLIAPGPKTAMPSEGNRRLLHAPSGKVPFRRQAIRWIRRLSPDWIQVENRPDFIPILRQKFPHTRILLNLHSLTFLGPQNITKTIRNRALSQADVVVLNSSYLKRAAMKRWPTATRRWNPVVIHPGVDAARFQHKDNVHRTSSSHQPLRLLFVGRVIHQKGVHVLLRAVRQLERQGVMTQLTLVGRTPPWERVYGQNVRRLARGLRVRWRGFVKPSQIAEVYRNHDILICPSQGPEAFGLVNLEAMAAGLVVIASKQGGIPEVVDSSSGILVSDYRQPLAFAESIRQLAQDKQRLARMQRGAKDRAGQFTWAKTASALRKIYLTTDSR